MKKISVVVLFFLIGITSVLAQTEKFGTWIEVELTKKFLKKFEISFIPDLRLHDDFTVDKYQFDSKLSYEPVDFLSLSAAYRIKTNVKTKGNEVSHRYLFDASLKKEVGRFTPSFRARLTNYNDTKEDSKVTFIRPRVKVAYDIKGNKIQPYTSYELFHDIQNKLTEKGRFDVGFTRKLGEYHRIGLYYRLQHYYDSTPSINILGIDYRFKI